MAGGKSSLVDLALQLTTVEFPTLIGKKLIVYNNSNFL